MTRFLFTILLLTATTSQVAGQNDEKEPEFSTAGEQEAYWARQLFKKEYKAQKHSKFTGRIQRLDAYSFKFDTVTLRVVNTSPDLLLIFDNGLLQPWASGLTISDIEELKDLSPAPTIKRFGFMLIQKGLANPIMYFFELTNKTASKTTDIKTFIKGSTLTFLKQGWVMI
ncbi:MAG TPA: hypothetical protein VIU12_12695 [Chryseolinea sp.]